MTAKLNLKINQGSTFLYTMQWESSAREYCQILSASRSAPLELIVIGTVPPLNWRTWFQGAQGMKELNRDDPYIVSGVNEQLLTFREVNSTNFAAYTGGGVLYYNKPVALALSKVRMQIRSSNGGLILDLNTDNGGILVDVERSTITLNISAQQTAQLNFKLAYFDIEVEDVTQRVTRLAQGTVRILPEVTK